MAQVPDHRLADVTGKREAIMPSAFSPHGDLPGSPVDVIQSKAGHFAGAQAESGKEEQDRVTWPMMVLWSQLFRRRSTCAGSRNGTVENRQFGTVGTAPARSVAISPRRCRKRRKERSAATIRLARPGLIVCA
jgi:hypothetical protein